MSVAPGVLWRCPGPRAAEELLLARVRELSHWNGRTLPRVLVVVPSAVLRLQLAARLAEASDGGLLGVEVATAWGLAERLCERHGVPTDSVAPLFGLLARRAAGAEPALAEVLGGLEDGFAAAVGSSSDLASAGLSAAELDALGRCWRTAGAAGERALALARVTLAASSALEELALARATDLPGRAANLLSGGAQLPGRPTAVLIHGFVDATGQTLALLGALLERGAELLLDEPPDPRGPMTRAEGVPAVTSREEAFGEHLRRRLGPRIGRREVVEVTPPAVELRCFTATGLRAETREVARRVGEALQRGVVPERIGVVAADLPRHALALQRSFSELGVPFSGPAAPPAAFPLQRRWRAALELLARGGDAAAETWLAAAPPGTPPLLRLALRALGAVRLADVAALDLEAILSGAEAYALPTRSGLAVDDEDGLPRARAERQLMPAAVLRAAVASAHRCLETLRSWPETLALPSAVQRFRSWLHEGLGWVASGEDARLAPLARAALAVTRLELSQLLGELGADLGVDALGGVGGGVQVLDATHARGLTFDELYLLGCNRGVFPRARREDPLLPDELRVRAATILPELQPKSRGRSEERHLFAQLMAAAPRVTLSWQRADEDGRALFAAPLLERLRHGAISPTVERLPRLHLEALSPPHAGGCARPRSERELGVMAALAAPRPSLGALLSASGAMDDEGVLGARLAALEELDPDLHEAAGRRRAQSPGPLLGFVGGLRRADDPRRAALYVTTLEDLARCPWKTLLEDVLRLSTPRDPRDALPGIDAQLVGEAAHQALETLVAPTGDVRERRAARGAGWAVLCPSAAQVQRQVAQAVALVAGERGLTLPGLRRALERRVLPLVARAVSLDWPHAAAQLEVVGAEQQRGIEIFDAEGWPRQVRFKADRVDRQAGETLVLSDYKTGRPLSRGRRAETRRRELRRAVARGERLQVAAYAAVAADAVGRYVFLDPALSDEEAIARLDGGDRAVRVVLPRVLRELVAAWEAGVFCPRLEDLRGDEPRTCGRCGVAEACLRGDSAARARLRAVVTAPRDGADEASPEGGALASLAALWRLGQDGTDERAG